MFRRPSIVLPRATSVALALAYAVLALGGQSLHAWAHAPAAGDSECVCSCGLPHAGLAGDGASPTGGHGDRIVRADSALGSHATHACPVCQALAKLKLGTAAEAVDASLVARSALIADSGAPAAPTASAGSVDARGPPAGA
jgi:hypothetical protein